MTQPVFDKFVKKSQSGEGLDKISKFNADKFFDGLIDLIYRRYEMGKSLTILGGIFIKLQAVYYNSVLTHECRNNIPSEILTDIKNYFIARKL